MFDNARDLLRQVSSAGDVAVVGIATLIGFTADAAINIIPIPIFSPGVCGVASGWGALSIKRGLEARQQARRRKHDEIVAADKAARLLSLALEEAARAEDFLRGEGNHAAADRLAFEARATRITEDHGALIAAVRNALVTSPSADSIAF